jgi:N6-L-threonylcarbamoyladenine synthase
LILLGLETSCDETSAAIVTDGRFVHSNVISSQVAVHAPFGGVVPEIASREHVRAITHITNRALQEAGLERHELEGIAATRGPGLAGALLVGLNFGRGLALGLNIPFIPVNHLEAHIYSLWLKVEEGREPTFPLVVLLVSGGHTQLILMETHGRYSVLGTTLDDAAGEAFDKVSRLLGLGYPGGPAIQRASEDATTPRPLPRARLPGTYDFSFSGLKTAALHAVRDLADAPASKQASSKRFAQVEEGHRLSDADKASLAAGLQESIVDVLVEKTIAAATACGAAGLGLAGGVAANRLLRHRLRQASEIPVHIADPEFATDNGAMIAAAGFYARARNDPPDVSPSLKLA